MPWKDKEKALAYDRKRYQRDRDKILAEKRSQYQPTPLFTKNSEFQGKVETLYRIGRSINQIAVALECSRTAVWGALKRLGIPRRGRSESIRLIQTSEVRKKMADAHRGKPSGITGKHWKVGRVIKRPWRAGENHPGWKGGRTGLQERIRTSVEYKTWRNAIFDRDNRICTECGAKSSPGNRITLHGHHKESFQLLLDRYHIKTIEQAVQCKEFWDIENGVTLCIDCHRKTDTYGFTKSYLERKDEDRAGNDPAEPRQGEPCQGTRNAC